MISIDEAKELLNFAGNNENFKDLGQKQLESTVALYNMIKNGRLGYLSDEVGMGKTYVALGVISLMRYINPSLKVLYILPKQNVLDKWLKKEYPNFLRDNFKVENNKVKSFDKKSAVPQIECTDLIDLIKYSSTGYYGDYFIKMSSFSFPLSDDKLVQKVKDLKKLIPSAVIDLNVEKKEDVKLQYAKNINKILPFFDLVLIDEAHNFRQNMDSSNRNKYLSIILGTNNDENDTIKKIDKVLLLSATPFDRDINQLINQLEMVGMNDYADELKSVKNNKGKVISILQKFMSRRLNELKIGNEFYTRNQYRVEKRAEAAIKLESIDQKLIVALVQKKVGELLDDDKFNGQYQTGMLASFESYLPSSKKNDTNIESEFDDTQDSNVKKAVDNNIIMHLHNSYTEEFNETSLPHPKMDSVVKEYAQDSFENGNKHIIFVRRIQSVTDLKTKFDKYYDGWIEQYLSENLQVENIQLNNEFKKYKEQNISKKSDVDSSEEDSSNNFFTYFFRGKNVNSTGTPFDIKNKINTVSKNDNLINSFEMNWFHIFNIEVDKKKLLEEVNRYEIKKDKNSDDLLKNEIFMIIQISYLQLIQKKDLAKFYMDKFNVHYGQKSNNISFETIDQYINYKSFFSYFEEVFENIDILNDTDYKGIEKIYFISSLISSILRLGHGIIDLFLAYTNNKDNFVEEFVNLLQKQKLKGEKFSSYNQIKELIDNIDLVIRNNFTDYKDSEKTVNNYISGILSPLEPVIGARGASGAKSAIARKFRMPGYPMILISTDVLQEGEDLHTFCDSVIHYGLSNSPMAIEQKNGRVDRIGSLGQRNLMADKSINNNSKLKVSFPFLQESIEVVQIHNLAQNLNDFITSIDTFEIKKVDINNDSTSVTKIKEIVKQIEYKLESSLNANLHIHDMDLNEEKLSRIIAKDKKKVEKTINYLLSLNVDKNMIGIAKSSSEFILRIEAKGEKKTIYSKAELLRYMQKISYESYHRTTISELEIGKGEDRSFNVSYNIEMLAGDDEITQQFEVDDIRNRINSKHLIDTQLYELSELFKLATNKELMYYNFTRNHDVELDIIQNINNIDIVFNFNQHKVHRQQKVVLEIKDGYVIFSSKATINNIIKTMDVDDIIKYTWDRNRYIDIVEFVVNNDGAIIGRVIFPCKHIHNKEILYNAYVLACEADHLEQILHGDDRF